MMMQGLFAETVTGLEAKLRAAGPDELVARKTLTLQTARLGERLFSGREPVAWCGVLAPFELLHALGVTSCFAEFVGATLAGAADVSPFIEAAEQSGYPSDACTYHRAVAGATLQGLLPEPAFLVATSTPCTGGVALLEEMARHFHKPLFVIHIPHRDDEASVRYLAGQLQRLVDFASEHGGQRLDPLELRQAIELSNEARELLVETYELASAVPTPARRRDLINFGIVISLCFGTREGVEVARAYRDEFARKVELGIGGIPGERLRLLWIQNRIQFRSPVEELLESGHGAAVVADELNAVTWDPIDPDDPLPGLARRMLASPFTGGIERRIHGLQGMARQYRVDGAINPCHWGCRQGTGARGLMAAGLREIDIPVLNLEVDCVDQRNFSEGQVRTRLEAFMEMLPDRKLQPADRSH